MAAPSWLEPLPDAAQQRAIDRWAIEQLGTPSATLMERAGTGLARVVAERVPEGRIAVLAGKGNNGGDGRVAARVLRDRGREVELIDVVGAEPGLGHRLSGVTGVVDALLGTGFSGTPRDPVAGAIAAINAAGEDGATVVACDVPSGVDASSGEVLAAAVHADHTVTFHAAKPGLWISPGKACAGEVTIVDIGIPARDSPVALGTGLVTSGVLWEVPRRGAGSNKFTSGHVLIVAGSARYTGAPAMVAMSAARAGAGYVTVAVPPAAVPILQTKLLEEMVTDHDGALELLERADCVVIGAGLGRGDAVAGLVRRLCAEGDAPTVLDADALNALAGDLAALRGRPGPTVLTPHAGELARLLETDSAEIAAHRLAGARRAAELAGAVVVLKGDDTIIAHPDGRIGVSPGGVPALATAGTGDVLGGVIGAYLAKGMDVFGAACAGVYAHLRAGALAAAEIGAEGVIASDVIAKLPRTLRAEDLEGAG
ncbi:MAG TPA: NAD(P)H-hydrate dehydratase [Solirubrobacteraceae bacterium]|nr:NAD(P)H-hydrate dehydratase [Solirubrobacteraceae bacterium]